MVPVDDDRLLELARAVRAWIRPELARSQSARRFAALVGEWLVEEARAAEAVAAAVEAAPDAAPSRPAAAPGPHEPLTPAERPAVAAAEAAAPAAAERVAAASQDAAAPAAADAPVPSRPRRSPWTLGDLLRADTPAAARDEPAPGSGNGTESAVEIDLDLVATRCRLKAASCRALIERRAAADDPVRFSAAIDRIAEQLAEAKALRECFLWALFREREQPDDDALDRIATCYEALAAAVELVARLDELEGASRADLEAAFQDMAEASSALRAGLRETWLTQSDRDQEETHLWLRERTLERGIFLARYMRKTDVADPVQAADLRARIDRRRESVERRAKRLIREREGFKQLRYHAHRVEGEPGPGEEHDLRRIADGVLGLLEHEVRTTDRRFAVAIPPGVAERALACAAGPARDLLSRLATADAATGADRGDASVPLVDATPRWSARVDRVRDLLRGRQIVVIGGEPRVDAVRRMEDAFSLKHVEWVRLSEHGSTGRMEAPIGSPDTALVLVLVKLAGHLHAEEARTLAKGAGKPYVLLPAGYNPEQMADAVLTQASEQLRAQM